MPISPSAMTDIHCHILPGIDDGPQTLEEAVAMARIAAQDGIRQIVAAPHLRQGVYEPTKEQILAKTAELADALKQADISVELIPAMDVHIELDLLDRLVDGDLITLGGDTRYVLLELPNDRVPSQIESLLHQCLLKRFVPILTHPERVLEIQNHLDRLEHWVNMGVLVQITAMSLTGGFGKKVQRTARRMVEYRLCHLIASEGHSSDKHPPVLSDAVQVAAGILGEEAALEMVTELPARILAGEMIDPPEPIVSEHKHWWRRHWQPKSFY